MKTKKQLIKEIEKALRWPDDIDSKWMNKLKVVELERVLYYSNNRPYPEFIEPSNNIAAMFIWNFTDEGHEYWEIIDERLS